MILCSLHLMSVSYSSFILIVGVLALWTSGNFVANAYHPCTTGSDQYCARVTGNPGSVCLPDDPPVQHHGRRHRLPHSQSNSQDDWRGIRGTCAHVGILRDDTNEELTEEIPIINSIDQDDTVSIDSAATIKSLFSF